MTWKVWKLKYCVFIGIEENFTRNGDMSGEHQMLNVAIWMNVLIEFLCCHILQLEVPFFNHFPSERGCFGRLSQVIGLFTLCYVSISTQHNFIRLNMVFFQIITTTKKITRYKRATSILCVVVDVIRIKQATSVLCSTASLNFRPYLFHLIHLVKFLTEQRPYHCVAIEFCVSEQSIEFCVLQTWYRAKDDWTSLNTWKFESITDNDKINRKFILDHDYPEVNNSINHLCSRN